MKKTWFILGLFLFCSMLGFAKPSIKIYQQFEDFQPLLKPEENYLLVVNFWASWCRPCVEELPALEKVRKEFSDQNIQFMLVNLDDPKKLKSHVIPLLQRLEVDAKVVILNDTDYNSWIDKVDSAWSGAIPGTLLIKGDSKAFYEKSFTYEQFKTLISNHLK